MEKMGLHEIRREFLDFFQEKGHLIMPSFSLIPKEDKSLLLINAGMAPLKPYFTGEKTPPGKRVTTCQKCFRTADIENVGKTARHATFFEMLGNFSFGDYFKKEAIEWSWEFLTKRLGIPEEDLWVSIYLEDDEAFEIWNKDIGLSQDKIIPLGKEDNFWELEVGPCGPCSEIYVDRGEEFGCGSPDCKPGCECDRFIEIWNLVFTQFDKDEEGNYHPLAHPNIDTGMGLERIAAVMEDASNIFEIKAIRDILSSVERVSNTKYGLDSNKDASMRIITDHSRAMVFLVSDGVLPSNEGRGYVLRRIIRRAARHGKLLGIEGKFLNSIVKEVIDSWKIEYPYIKEKEEYIKKVISSEEEKFQETIHQGISILGDYIENMENNEENSLDGKRAFKLYDTYGFPLDLTREILEEKGLKVNEDEFNQYMERQREMARNARTSDSGWKSEDSIVDLKEYNNLFRGYELLDLETEVSGLFLNNESVGSMNKDEEGIIIIKETPFYAESGGQVGDTGYIKNDNFLGEVLDTKYLNNTIAHFVKVREGSISIGDRVYSIVDVKRRKSIMRNHSATHLLHQALKEILGEHVNQAGSIVLPNRLRFDFTHFEAVSKEEIKEIEKIVNEKILEDLDVKTIETTLEESKSLGVIGLFEDKYENEVRVVQMGDFSMELCGGTHVKNTGNIGLFKIISESSIASGVRRIEAITGEEVYNYLNEIETDLDSLSNTLKTNREGIINKAEDLMEEIKEKDREIESLKSKMALSIVDEILNGKKDVGGINLVVYNVENMDMNSLRNLGDEIKNKLGTGIIVLASVHKGKISFVSMVTKDLLNKGIHAGNIIRDVAKITGGGGGGRPDMAQAGGKDLDKVKEALGMVEDIVKKQLK